MSRIVLKKVKNRVWTPARIAQLKHLRESGKTFQQCADAMGLPYMQLAQVAYHYYLRNTLPRYRGTKISLVGQKFRMFTVVSKIRKPRYRNRAWVVWQCVCDCGRKKALSTRELVYGHQQSCGCLRITHGMTKTPTYISWASMRQRCRDKANTAYGGREIPVTVCERWQGKHGFENFLADLGQRPEGLTLERQDPNGNYEPGNCAWANKCHQELNKRRDVKPGEPGYVDPLHNPEPGTFEGEEAF